MSDENNVSLINLGLGITENFKKISSIAIGIHTTFWTLLHRLFLIWELA